MRVLKLAPFLALAWVGGCVERTLTVKSDPPGALVSLNDQEIGRTPVTRDFTWYGNYDVEVRAEGYQTLKTTTHVNAPWWQWVPIDLGAELLPVRCKDHQSFSYTLRPLTDAGENPKLIIKRGEAYSGQLESGELTRKAGTTRPATSRKSATTQGNP